MPRRTDTRLRMLAAAETLLAVKGYAATTLDDVVAASGTPRGSVYHHFPGGKDQIVLESAQNLAVSMPGLVRELAANIDPPAEVVRAFFARFAQLFDESEHRRGCPVAATTLEASSDATLLAELNNVFANWRAAFATCLTDAGIAEHRARAAAAVILSGFEGALIQARAARDGHILGVVGEELAGYVQTL